jgi:hypothetical protein
MFYGRHKLDGFVNCTIAIFQQYPQPHDNIEVPIRNSPGYNLMRIFFLLLLEHEFAHMLMMMWNSSNFSLFISPFLPMYHRYLMCTLSHNKIQIIFPHEAFVLFAAEKKISLGF